MLGYIESIHNMRKPVISSEIGPKFDGVQTTDFLYPKPDNISDIRLPTEHQHSVRSWACRIWDGNPWCDLLIYFFATLSICWWLGVLGRRWTTWLFWPSRLGGRLGSGVLGCFFARTRGEASGPGGRPCAGLWRSAGQRNRGCELTFSCLLFLLRKRFCLGLFSL